MGISAAQAKLLAFTDRKHSIGFELTRLANDKLDLTRDMDKVTKEYQQGLSAKTLKWSPNSGITYYDLTYNNLMKPGQMNGNSAYLITDSAEKVVIGYDYKKYAEMISPKGAPGGDWESNRAKILSELTGVPVASINSVDSSSTKVQSASEDLKKVKAKEPEAPSITSDITELLEKVGSNAGQGGSFIGCSNWAEAYKKEGGTINLGNQDPHNILSNAAQVLADELSKYFITESSDWDPKKSPIYNAINELVGSSDKKGILQTAIDNQQTSNYLSKDDSGNWSLNVNEFINGLFNVYLSQFTVSEGANSSKVKYYDTTSNEFNTYKTEHDNWESELAVAQKAYDDAVNADNSLLTANEEAQIEFYDDIFSTIAEKGWTYNESINDEDYLNQMLQNNEYTITTVDRNKVKSNEFTEDYFWENTYNTDIATNYTNIFTVNDAEARNDAQVEYDRKKALINSKETKIDLRMQDLKTEQEAINTMIQSLESILDENVDRTMNIFG